MANDFSNWGEAQSPTSDDVRFGWSIKRTPATKIIKLGILSAEHFGIYTHYHHGRTTPHLITGCEPCSEGKLPRWYGYVLAMLSPTKEQVIFEFSAGCAETVIKAEQDFSGLRGCVCLASRPRGKDNSPIHLQFTDARLNPASLPPDQAIRPLLARIWGFKPDAKSLDEHRDIRLAAESETAAAGLKINRVPLSQAAISKDGEVMGLLNRIGELPGQQHLPFQNGHPMK